ncbi:LacI family transcriptional regulator [Rhizobiaceae bacterium BDR2-2]|uniref:LacI family transcriptional regulator n=1 Tax=Ectorhizobium quercum TaxID=2965071 RepID=A0AAE3N4Z9_9HYPH|nr:LacI family transcriptional regulator [Ectorhizobium quercum]MCX8999794.1 LacI family transcriptional regulator [Ectorhizobium quercum]
MDFKNTRKNAAVRPDRRRPTLKTIAEETGLGITTVSRALKDAPDIGADTKQRVRDVALRLGYRPNRAGVRLRTGKTNVVALVLSVDEEVMGFASHLLYGLSEVLSGTPYHLIMTPHFISGDPLAPIRYIIETGSADGVIISRTEPDDPRVRMMLHHGIPFVTHGRTEIDTPHAWHDFDNERFIVEAIGRLKSRGRRRIAVLQPPDNLTCHAHIRSGMSKALSDADCVEVPLAVTTDSDIAETRRELLDLLRSADPPDGIVTVFGNGAIAVLSAVRHQRLKIGEDIDLICKQPLNALHWLEPQVIAVNEDIRDCGRELASLLLAAIDGAAPETLHSLHPPRWDAAGE